MPIKSIRLLAAIALALACAVIVSVALASGHARMTTTAATETTTATTATTAATTATATTTTATRTAAKRSSTFPTKPITYYTPNTPFFLSDGLGQYEGTPNRAGFGADQGYFTSGYWVNVPPSYDRSNRTPETLVVWLHGCGSPAQYDIQALTSIYNSNRPYIVIALSGPEAGTGSGPMCWDTHDGTDVQKVLLDIDETEAQFNINRRRVIIAGYSSGGDLAYQTIFTHASTFAGILAFNTDPVVGDIFDGSISRAVAAASRKFPIVQVVHISDDEYRMSEVMPHLRALEAAGFHVSITTLPGHHYDPDAPAGCENHRPATCTSGTYHDIVHSLLPHIAADHWEAPAPSS